MKLTTLLLAASVAANFGLAALVMIERPWGLPAVDTHRVSTLDANAVLWRSVDGDDPAVFEKKLREAGLPEHFVTALLAAEARERRRQQRESADLAHDEQSATNATSDSGAQRERPRAPGRQFAGPLGHDLEFIAPSRREQARVIARDYDVMIADIRRGGAMLTESEKQMLEVLEAERRRELGTFLSPQELGDFEMLKSPLYRRLAYETSEFNPTLAEFRAIFAQAKEYADRFDTSSTGRMPPRREDWAAARQYLTAADDLLLAQFGTDRFAAYERSRNAEYRELAKLTRRLNLPESQAGEVFSMRDYVSAESSRIVGDTTRSTEERLVALQTLGAAVRREIQLRLGDEGSTAYLRFADKWLSQVEAGSSVTFERNTTHFRRLRGLPPPTLPPPPGG